MMYANYAGTLRNDMGRKLRHMRQMADVTQKECATKVGISQSEWSSYELGKKLIPESLKAAICGIFRQDTNVFDGGELKYENF